jgi:murein L,D-transpeptidase YcbB/YkuD
MLNGRLDPADTKAEVYMQPKPLALDSVLALALQETSFKRLSEDLRPRYEQYTQLREALDRYRKIPEDGGWPTLEEGASLEPGKPSPQVPRLRERLAASGDLSGYDPDDTSRVFGADLAAALAAFQQRHSLAVDTLVGPSTLAALNVTVEERIGQIVLNLERWRWLPSELGARYILVNIPDYTLAAYDEGEEVLTMPVVVGAEYEGRKTPVFSDVMEYVVFQPYWNVPPSIATDEILPKAYEDDSYLERNGYELVESYAPDAGTVEVDEESLAAVAEGKYRIRQLPGRSNALGNVKFMFPNEHNIYLHDTPADHLFKELERDYSHGCIRVERPEDLASYVLSKNEKKWSQSEIDEAMLGEREVVVLDQQIPVYIMYLSAFVGKDGAVYFRDDIDGYDADLAAQFSKKKASLVGEEEEDLCKLI